MVFVGTTLMESNEVGNFGGAVFADKSDITFHESSLISRNKAQYGGAIHAMDSNMDYYGNYSFMHNLGKLGGGWSLIGKTLFNCSRKSSIMFEANNAGKYGGAIWIEDSSLHRCINDARYW